MANMMLQVLFGINCIQSMLYAIPLKKKCAQTDSLPLDKKQRRKMKGRIYK